MSATLELDELDELIKGLAAQSCEYKENYSLVESDTGPCTVKPPGCFY